MKKILILLSFIFLLTGCYDNIELDDLAIITGVGIDYKDDNFYLTYEILSDTKTEENTALLSYTVSGSGKSISEAFINTNYMVSKKAYFAHLKVVVISEQIINGHFNEITDYILRDTNIRSEFKVVVANGISPEEVLKNNSENHPVVSEVIVNLIDNEKYNNNLVIGETFKQIVAKLISDNYDVILNTVSIKDKQIAIDNSYILKKYNYQTTLSKQDSALFNMLTKNITAMEFDKKYDNKNVTISITSSDTSIDVNSNKIIINTNLEGKVIENNANFDLTKNDAYQKLNKDFGILIEKDIKNFVELLQANESDILGFQEIYYKKTRKENKELWKHADIEVKVNLKVNTKGFIFEVKNDK
ncbi:MAG: Ger(x)C family spore germination protein [Firmicutes bacterium]|nr:Ger(x)C family spore germination protein [Bacillota bacterium]